MSSNDNADRRMEAAALQMLQTARVGIVFTIHKDKKRKDDLVQGRYFSWLASQPPSFHMSRPLADIMADKELTVQVDLEGVKLTIPRLVYEICTYLRRSRQLGTEGLLRKSGNASRVRMLQQHLDAYGKLPIKELKENKYTCHDLIQVLKTFLRHLPGGIIHSLYKSFVIAQRVKHEEDHVTRRSDEEIAQFGLKMTLCLCYLLPTPNQHLLQYLMHFFVDQFGPAQQERQSQNTMTLDNIARILGPTLLPTGGTTSKPGSEDEAEFVIDAVRDMMHGYKRGQLYTSYLKEVCDRAALISPQEAQRLYKSGFADKYAKPKRRSRASGLGDALRSAGEEMMKTLQRRGSSRSNIADKSTTASRSASTQGTPKMRRKGRRSLGDPETLAAMAKQPELNTTNGGMSTTSSFPSTSSSSSATIATATAAATSSSSGVRVAAVTRSRSLKRTSDAAHPELADDNARQKFKFGDQPPAKAPATKRPGRIISAAEAKRKAFDIAPVHDPRQQAKVAPKRTSSEPTGLHTTAATTTRTTPITTGSAVAAFNTTSGTLTATNSTDSDEPMKPSAVTVSRVSTTDISHEQSAVVRRHTKTQTPRSRRRSFEGMRRLGDGLTGSAKKVRNFMQRRRSSRAGSMKKKSSSTSSIADTNKENDDDNEGSRDLFLNLLPQTSQNDSDVITLEELNRFSQMCYEAQEKLDSSKAASGQTPARLRDAHAVTRAKHASSSSSSSSTIATSGVSMNSDSTRDATKHRVVDAKELQRPPRKTRVGKPLVIRHPAASRFGVGRLSAGDDTPSRGLLDTPSSTYVRKTRRTPIGRASPPPTLSISPARATDTSDANACKRGKRTPARSNNSSTKSQRTALGDINNKSPKVSNHRTPLLQQEDRFTFV
ncbi:hypothetical protein PTSG_09581 [Salpingoeca rosetta]|uniref:Rho-GAP domain-containing protein n=1 Tax=Salpingoeca rosetta (strain ATCC 50818 / BSB-021) TaxID=946362 RepID=F2ULE9_SALR5|nr:uncharacterized protein PTSG_09581 [Salpingoeca rosetta]EGD77948.1 hypothetical protein PTSG_09581 [Salpingoeca rosetta]|eukprot:XP_004990011.1 hypothetical protein PTSG_09581 [Salpingoeca rosetta]